MHRPRTISDVEAVRTNRTTALLSTSLSNIFPESSSTSSAVRSSKVAPTGAAGKLPRRRGGNFRLSSLFGSTSYDALASEHSVKLKAQTDMRVLVSRIHTYRDKLTSAERTEFDGEIK